MTSKPKEIWFFDVNRRIYPKMTRFRHYSSGPIWREHWVRREIVGETSRSWVTSHDQKIPKNAPLPRGFAWTEADINELAWVKDHAHRISNYVMRCCDSVKLRQIAAIVEYKEETS
jgi:hypothetical protein